MSTIVLRSVKGTPLTNAEVDNNFSNLNTDKLEAATSATLTNKTINLTSNTLVATSAQLAAALTDETGTGVAVFSASPALTGTPTAPTAAAATNTTQIATTAHVFAERTNTATLTNKTITGGTVNPTTLQEGSVAVVVQTDIGSAPNEIPLNQYLGNLAYQDAANIAGPVGVGGPLTVVGATTLAAATMASATVTNAVEAGGGAVAEQLVVDNFTASSSAVLRGGSTNLFTYSEQFNDAAWTKTASSITANTIVAPDGALTGDALIENTATAEHVLIQTVTTASNSARSFSVYAKAAGRSVIRLLFDRDAGFTDRCQAIFDLASGTVVSASNAGTGSGAAGTIVAVGNGWYRCTLTGTPSTTAGTTLRNIVYLQATSGGSTSYTGDGTSGVFIWGAQLNVGATPAAYLQTVATAVTTAYAAPIESPNGLAFPLLSTMTPARNADMTFELASDTSLVVKVRGSDGTVRSATLLLV